LGQTISLSQLYGKISEQPGVLNVIDIRVFNEFGGTYSDSQISQPYMAQSSTNPSNNRINVMDQTLFFLPDEIPQIKYPDVDIRVRVKQIDRPNFS